MKYLRRYLSLLFALVMSLSLFSVTALAEEVDSSKVKVNYSLAYQNANNWSTESIDQINAFNGVLSDEDFLSYSGRLYFLLNSAWNVKSTFVNTDGSPLFNSGSSVEFTADNFLNGDFYIYNDDGSILLYKDFKSSIYAVDLQLVYSDGSYSDYIRYSVNDCVEFNTQKNTFRFKFNINAEKDVTRMIVFTYHRPFESLGSSVTRSAVLVQGGFLNYPLVVIVDQESKEEGLLGGILGKISDLWSTAEAGFANMVKGITELPQKLWSLIENGLKSLFVPTEESMTAYKDKWEQLLSSRLGAVYQVVNILTESWDSVMAADETDTIVFPSATINLSGTSFSFGGYTVQIVPDGFGVLVTAIKTIVGIVCSIAFINGLRKRYDEIMGVEQ